MKLSHISEAAYQGSTAVVAIWSDSGTRYVKLPRKQIERLKKLASGYRAIKSEDHADHTEREMNQIIQQAEELRPDFVFDDINYEWVGEPKP